MKPPAELDSGKVLYWAWSGEKPFGNLPSGDIDIGIYGFAVCLLAGTIYRFSCDRQWEVQQDSDYPNPQEAMGAFYPQYQNQPIHWQKYDDTNIDTLMDEIRMVPFYIERGGRRIIQKIVSHMKQQNCSGMAVQSISEDQWLLSIQTKDIPIASEVVKSNV